MLTDNKTQKDIVQIEVHCPHYTERSIARVFTTNIKELLAIETQALTEVKQQLESAAALYTITAEMVQDRSENADTNMLIATLQQAAENARWLAKYLSI